MDVCQVHVFVYMHKKGEGTRFLARGNVLLPSVPYFGLLFSDLHVPFGYSPSTHGLHLMGHLGT